MKHCLSSKLLDLNDCMGIRSFNKVSHEVFFCLNCNWLQSTRNDTSKNAGGGGLSLTPAHAVIKIGVSSIAVHKRSLNPELLNFKAGVLKVV